MNSRQHIKYHKKAIRFTAVYLAIVRVGGRVGLTLDAAHRVLETDKTNFMKTN
jgi:hypothetical protein